MPILGQISKSTMTNNKLTSAILQVLLLLIATGLAITTLFLIKSNNQLNTLLLEANLNIEEKDLKIKNSQWLINQYKQYSNQEIKNINIARVGEQKKPIRTILGNRHKVIYKFSSLDCTSCIEFEIKNLANKLSLFYTDIVILVETNDKRWLKDFINRNKLTCNFVYQIEHPLREEGEPPFYCAINNELLLRDILFPIKELPHLSDAYYQYIQEKYLAIQ